MPHGGFGHRHQTASGFVENDAVTGFVHGELLLVRSFR
jgi:hypothetical protein